MTDHLIHLAEKHQFQELFLEHLNWSAPDTKPRAITLEDGETVTVTNVATYKGIRVWVCPRRPGSSKEAEIDRSLAKTSVDRIVVFYDEAQQVWRWPVRRTHGGNTSIRLSSHRHQTGAPNPKFAERLVKIQLPDDVILDANTVLTRVREAFDVESQNETRHASQLMARLYSSLRSAYPDPEQAPEHEISVILARFLFLAFGDDTEMWETDAFRNYLHLHTQPDGSDIARQLNALFERLDLPGDPRAGERFAGFKYVNGGLFSDPVTVPDAAAPDLRQCLMEICVVDWADISPAIFGSMFQSVRDAETRRSLGEHYTSEENILKTLNPLFLDELRTAYSAALGRDSIRKQINALEALWKRLGDIRFMDPACGCGNFIIVAYRELRDLELNVMDSLRDLRGEDQHTLPGEMVRALRVTLDHFYGIEIDEWPATIAQTAMFLVDRQCDLKLRERFGEAPERLPIQTEARITVGDALLTDWNVVGPPDQGIVYVAGNPPFIGQDTRTKQQLAAMLKVWGLKSPGRLDFVTAWHIKSMDFLAQRQGDFAFVTTNSVTQGEQVPVLYGRIKQEGWRIAFAHRTFGWTSEATGSAAVHCTIVGYTRDTKRTQRVWDYSTGTPLEHAVKHQLNGYLIDGPDLLISKASNPISPVVARAVLGAMPKDGNYFTVEARDYPTFAADPVAARYLRPYVGSRELVQGLERWVLWLTDLDPQDLVRSELLAQRVEGVRQYRLNSDAPSTVERATTPHLFAQRSQPKTDYLCIPSVVSENRPYFTASRLPRSTIVSSLAFAVEDPDGLQLAIVSSSMFITWQRAIGGRLESRLRFASTLTWHTFPAPQLTYEQRHGLIEAANQITDVRAAHGLSLAALYVPGQLPEDLQAAHDGLDLIMDGLFGLDSPTEEERLEALFVSYSRITHQEG